MSWLRDEVLRHADIVEVVSEYLPLKKKGSNYWALSPFKPEKTPSFAVSPSKQIFKCFASGKGGDVIRFVMEMEGISYYEALQKLARKYNIPLPETPDKQPSQNKERQRYLAIYQEAVRFYREKFPGSPAEAYLYQRGLQPETIEAFHLGYAPSEGNLLTQHLLRLGYSEEQLIAAGVSTRSETTGRLYDRFRGRVIFPIQDEQGAFIAFAGRSLGNEEPKYLNSPDTILYRKSEVLYGLHQARPVLRKDKPALIVEGYMDVISLHQAGFTEAVATCGTALTADHLAKLKRYTRKITLLYDSDAAGQAATERAIFTALSAGFFVSVATLSEAKDPDELLRSIGPQALYQSLEERRSWVSYLVQTTPSDLPEQRYHLIQKLGEGLSSLPDPLLRRVYAEEIEKVLRIPLDFWDSYQQAAAAARRSIPLTPQHITAERELIRIMLTHPIVSFGGMPLWEVLQKEFQHLVFAHPIAEAVRQALCEWTLPHPPSFSELAEKLSPEAQDWLSEVLMEKYTLSPRWRAWDDTPLEEDPVTIAETNLNLLHLNHLQRLLEENLSILSSLNPEEPVYEEHLSLHQVLLRQRAELAHRAGVLLPYKTSEGGKS